MNNKKQNEKNEDIEIKIREFKVKKNGKKEEVPRRPYNTSVDFLSYLILDDQGVLWKRNLPDSELKSSDELLFGIRKMSNDNSYKIINSLKISKQTKKSKEEIQNLEKKLWYLVNSGEDKDKINEDYILNENDIIRLKKCCFEVIRKKIKKIDNSNSNKNELLYDISSLNNKFGPVFKFDKDKGEKSEKNNENNLSIINNNNNSTIKEDNSKDSNISKNSILKLCDCYNHFECIKAQLLSELKIEQKLKKEKVVSFNLDEFKCSVCGKNIPLRFEKSGKIYNFLEFENMDYIVLEYLGKFEENNDENEELKKVYIIKLENDDEILIGRNNKDCMNIPDETISKNHAVLKFNKRNGTLFLENRNKKYTENTSTFVLIKGDFKLNKNKIKFLTGSCYITINLKEKVKNNKK